MESELHAPLGNSNNFQERLMAKGVGRIISVLPWEFQGLSNIKIIDTLNISLV